MRSIKDDKGRTQVVFDEPILCYPGRAPKLTEVGMTARNTLVGILMVMDSNNNFRTDQKNLDLIQKILQEIMHTEYTLSGIRNAISELNNFGLILRAKNQDYYVNPDYYVQLHPQAHKESLRLLLFKAGIYNNSSLNF